MIYYIFAGATYYRGGGFEDFKFSCNSKEEIEKRISVEINDKSIKGKRFNDTFNYGVCYFHINHEKYDWVQIIETEDGNLSNGRDITSSYELR